jgi:hypothetical protein
MVDYFRFARSRANRDLEGIATFPSSRHWVDESSAQISNWVLLRNGIVARSVSGDSRLLLQLRVLGFSLLQDGNVRVGVLP